MTAVDDQQTALAVMFRNGLTEVWAHAQGLGREYAAKQLANLREYNLEEYARIVERYGPAVRAELMALLDGAVAMGHHPLVVPAAALRGHHD